MNTEILVFIYLTLQQIDFDIVCNCAVSVLLKFSSVWMSFFFVISCSLKTKVVVEQKSMHKIASVLIS